MAVTSSFPHLTPALAAIFFELPCFPLALLSDPASGAAQQKGLSCPGSICGGGGYWATHARHGRQGPSCLHGRGVHGLEGRDSRLHVWLEGVKPDYLKGRVEAGEGRGAHAMSGLLSAAHISCGLQD